MRIKRRKWYAEEEVKENSKVIGLATCHSRGSGNLVIVMVAIFRRLNKGCPQLGQGYGITNKCLLGLWILNQRDCE